MDETALSKLGKSKTMDTKKPFHDLYLAVYRAHRDAPEIFTDHECNRILTAIMGGKSFSWRVIGITEAALRKFAEFDFKHIPRQGLTRAHLKPRIETTRTLLSRNPPYSAGGFMKFWIGKDETILCAIGENKISLPSYLPISNPEGSFFSSEGKLAGWHHRRRERDFLRGLYEDYRKGNAVPTQIG